MYYANTTKHCKQSPRTHAVAEYYDPRPNVHSTDLSEVFAWFHAHHDLIATDTLRHDTGWPPHFPSPSLIDGSDTATIVSLCQDNVEYKKVK